MHLLFKLPPASCQHAHGSFILCGWTVKLWFISFTILFGKKQLFRLKELRGALSCLYVCCMCYNSPRAGVSELAEFHSDLLPKGKRPMFRKRINHLHEESKQFFWHHFLCRWAGWGLLTSKSRTTTATLRSLCSNPAGIALTSCGLSVF